jgi:hypothetical protein
MPGQPPPPTLDGTLRTLRTVYLVLLAAMLLYILIAERAQHQLINMNRTFLAGLGGIAAIGVVIALYVQAKMIRPALETLQAKPDNAASLGRWRSGSLASYVVAEGIVLFGLCLRFLGGTRAMALPFYGVGIVMMIFLFPRRP